MSSDSDGRAVLGAALRTQSTHVGLDLNPTPDSFLFISLQSRIYFSSVYRPASDVNIAQICISHLQLSDLELSLDEVRDHLKSLDTSKASGPDGIPARLLKECCDQIAPSLCAIFNQSLGSAKLPSEWKSADIVPIHKKDSKELAEHYRPISLLPIVSKVLERCVFNRLYEHLKRLTTDLQHGFMCDPVTLGSP